LAPAAGRAGFLTSNPIPIDKEADTMKQVSVLLAGALLLATLAGPAGATLLTIGQGHLQQQHLQPRL